MLIVGMVALMLAFFALFYGFVAFCDRVVAGKEAAR
jgi:hypothetical protein